MITFVYLKQIGVYDSLTNTIEWGGETLDASTIPHAMRVQIENASC